MTAARPGRRCFSSTSARACARSRSIRSGSRSRSTPVRGAASAGPGRSSAAGPASGERHLQDHRRRRARGPAPDRRACRQTLIGKIDIDVSRGEPEAASTRIVEAVGRRGAACIARDDAGAERRTQVNSNRGLIARPFYYTYVDADPKNADVVWVNNLSLWKSIDGGKTFEHSTARRMATITACGSTRTTRTCSIQSNDGGANVIARRRAHVDDAVQPADRRALRRSMWTTSSRIACTVPSRTTRPVIVPGNAPSRSRARRAPLQYWTQGAGCETGPVKPTTGQPADRVRRVQGRVLAG